MTPDTTIESSFLDLAKACAAQCMDDYPLALELDVYRMVVDYGHPSDIAMEAVETMFERRRKEREGRTET